MNHRTGTAVFLALAAVTGAHAAEGVAAIKLDEAAQKRAEITVSRLEPTHEAGTLRAYASVLDLTELRGLVEKYAEAQGQVQASRARLAASRSGYERALRLHRDDQNVSTAEFQSAEAGFRADEALAATATAHLQFVEAAARQDWGAIIGDALPAGSAELHRLVAGQDVLVQVTTSAAASGDAPSAAIDRPGQPPIPLTYLSPAGRSDPRIPGVGRLYTALPDAALVPGTTLVASVSTSASLDGTAVPESAIVSWQGADWIYLKTGADSFVRQRIVPAGALVPDLPVHADVVVHGAQSLLSEELKLLGQTGDDD